MVDPDLRGNSGGRHDCNNYPNTSLGWRSVEYFAAKATILSISLASKHGSGDLYLLATAMLAPLALYISLRRGNLSPPSSLFTCRGGWAFILFLALLFGASVFLFSVKRISDLPNTALKINQEFFSLLSFIIYALSFALSLIVTCIKFVFDSLTPQPNL